MASWTYIVRCADGSLYTGWSRNPTKRVEVHNRGRGAKYTRSRLPVVLVWSQELESDRAARQREAQIKKLTRTQKLELIRGVE